MGPGATSRRGPVRINLMETPPKEPTQSWQELEKLNRELPAKIQAIIVKFSYLLTKKPK
jgi:hypothetical protein